MIFTFFSNLVHIVNLLTIFYMIFKENRSSKSIISWTLVLFILPYIGLILFLMLGRKVNTK
ncbi:cardiolipin synthase, partial [Clostridium perfringens]